MHELAVKSYESPKFYELFIMGVQTPTCELSIFHLIIPRSELCLNCIDTEVLQDIPHIRVFTSYYGD